MVCTKETGSENLKHSDMVRIVPPILKNFFFNNAKPLICDRPVP